jgi:hypothetical protein
LKAIESATLQDQAGYIDEDMNLLIKDEWFHFRLKKLDSSNLKGYRYEIVISGVLLDIQT